MKLLTELNRRWQLFLKGTVEPLLREYPVFHDVPLWISAVLVGLTSVFYARLFIYFERISVRMVDHIGLWIFLVFPVCLIIAWALVFFLAPGAEGSGIPQTMAATTFRDSSSPVFSRLFSIRVLVVKVLSSVVALVGGGVVGREGPTLQLSTGIFHFFSTRMAPPFKMPHHRILIAAGGGAGLAAAFNTPLGGIVFTIEELVSEHLSKFRTSLFTAVILSGVLSQLLTGSYLFLGFPKVQTVAANFIIMAIVIGAVTGALGAWYGYLIRLFSLLRLRYFAGRRGAFWAAGVGLILATGALFLGPNAMGSGHYMIHELLFSNSEAPWWLAIVRVFGSVFTYSAGVAGGIFAPSLASGAAFGAQIAGIVGDANNANLMILLGMIGFLTGITRAPFTAFVLVLEMTDRHSAIFLMMTAALAAYGAARLVQRESFYEQAAQKYKKWETQDEATGTAKG